MGLLDRLLGRGRGATADPAAECRAGEGEWDFLRTRPDFDEEEMSAVRGGTRDESRPLAVVRTTSPTRSLRPADAPAPWCPRSDRRKSPGRDPEAPGWVLELEVECGPRRWFMGVEQKAQIGRFDSASGICPEIDFTEDDAVSRQHALIYGHSGHFWLRDLFSTNGTLLNGETARSGEDMPLRGGDEICLGEFCRIRVQERPELVELSDEDAQLNGLLFQALGQDIPEDLKRRNDLLEHSLKGLDGDEEEPGERLPEPRTLRSLEDEVAWEPSAERPDRGVVWKGI